MKKTYNITEEKFLQAKQALINNGATLYRNNTFEIQGVEGKYSYENGVITILITDKPWLASWSMIEDKLDSFFK